MTNRVLVLAAFVTSLVLGAAVLAPATAVVRFEPTPEPVPQRWTPDATISVPWADVIVRMPSAWSVSVKPEPAFGPEGGAALLVAFGPGETMCMLDVYDAETIETWQDVGVQPSAELTIAGHRAERFDDMFGPGSVSVYSVYAATFVYSLMCSADRVPDDRWLSIAETLELSAAPQP